MLGLWIPLSCKLSVWETENQTLPPMASHVWFLVATVSLSRPHSQHSPHPAAKPPHLGLQAAASQAGASCTVRLFSTSLCSVQQFPGSWWKPCLSPNPLCSLPSFLVSSPAFRVPSVSFILWTDHSIRDHPSLSTFDDLMHVRAASAHPLQ